MSIRLIVQVVCNGCGEESETREEAAAAALACVHGAEINPFSAELARWRLKIAALTHCGLVSQSTYETPPKWVDVVHRKVAWMDSLLPHDHPMQPYNQDVHDAHLGPTRREPS